MNKHTVTLSTAKKLKELGFEKETLFWYGKKAVENISPVQWEYNVLRYDKYGDGFLPECPAPIASELLEELKVKRVTKLFYSWVNLDWVATCLDAEEENKHFHDKNPAEALALMWIYLKENKMI